MGNRAADVLTSEQYKETIEMIYNGLDDIFKPNPRIATALVVETNTGLRIGDVLSLRRSSFVKDNKGYRFNIVEQKTGKSRTFPVQKQVYDFLMDYIENENIEGDNPIFPITVRGVQKHLRNICNFLGDEYNNISTHSYRKFFGTKIYYENGCDIELVRRLYQHSSAAVSARYIGVNDEKIKAALDNVVNIPKLK